MMTIYLRLVTVQLAHKITARIWQTRHRLYATLPAEPELAHAQVILLPTPLAVANWLANVPHAGAGC